jgi:hypothetical protein
MTGFSHQPIESVEMTHLAPTFLIEGEKHPTLKVQIPALSRVDEGRTRHRARAVKPLDTFDRRNLCKPGLARPGVDGRGLVAGVDGKPRDAQMRAAFVRPGPVEQRGLSRREAAGYGQADASTVNVTINARDAESFRQSRTQVASDIARAVSLGRRGM